MIAHVDMDCFFCACEQKRRPYLKNKPFIVAAPSSRAVVSSANYKARAYGIRSAMPIFKVKMLHPQTLVVPLDINYYREESQKVMSILKHLGDYFQQSSIDEAYLTKNMKQREFAELVQRAIQQQTNLDCSIGVANCKITAKIATEQNKPFGITIVDNQAAFLAPLSIQEFPGIGKKAKQKFIQNSIETIGDLARADKFKIIELFGLHGIYYQQIARGQRQVQLKTHGPRKSMSAERTFNKDITSQQELITHLEKICFYLHKRLKGAYFKTISIKIKYADFSVITRDHSLKTMNNSLHILHSTSSYLLKTNRGIKPVRLLGVKASNFRNAEQTVLTIY